MFRKTAIALSLAMVAGTGFAQTNAGADTSASSGTGNASADVSANSSLAARFKQLDSNNDGMLSRSEAMADPKVGKIYSSLDTDSTIEKNKSDAATTGGISEDQFVSGMQAAMKGGVVGPAASGGGTYTQMKDGSLKKSEGMKSRMKSSMDSASGKTGSAMGGMSDKMHSSAKSASDKMSGMKNRMQASGSAMGDKARAAGNKMSSDTSEAYRNGMDKANQAADTSNQMKTGAGANAQGSTSTSTADDQ